MSIASSPGELTGCQNCAYRMKSQAEAVEILQTMVRTAHMKSIKGGGTLMTARLDEDITVKLCLWDVGCEECEAGEDFGDGSELASHESEQ